MGISIGWVEGSLRFQAGRLRTQAEAELRRHRKGRTKSELALLGVLDDAFAAAAAAFEAALEDPRLHQGQLPLGEVEPPVDDPAGDADAELDRWGTDPYSDER